MQPSVVGLKCLCYLLSPKTVTSRQPNCGGSRFKGYIQSLLMLTSCPPAPVLRSLPHCSVLVEGVAVEDLCLTFTLPGFPEFSLVEGGDDKVSW